LGASSCPRRHCAFDLVWARTALGGARATGGHLVVPRHVALLHPAGLLIAQFHSNCGAPLDGKQAEAGPPQVQVWPQSAARVAANCEPRACHSPDRTAAVTTASRILRGAEVPQHVKREGATARPTVAAVGRSITVLGNRRAHAYWPSPSDLNDSILPGSGWLLEEAVDINDGGQILGVGNHSGQRRAFLLTPTKWGGLDLGFLGYVTSVIIGVRNDAGGWVRPPGGRPEPVPPWFARIWSGLPEAGKRMLRGLAIRDRTTLIRDSEAWEGLRTLVPELEMLERESAAPSDRGA